MKKTIIATILALGLVTTNAQNTNIISGPAVDVINFLTASSTNWMIASYGIYAGGENKYGAGIGAFYNINNYFGAGLRMDALGDGAGKDWEVWMPSGSFQLQLPVKIMNKLELVPFVFSGIATPLSGRGKDNGTVQGIFGVGAAVRVSKRWDVVYDYENWSGFKGNQHRFGFLYKF